MIFDKLHKQNIPYAILVGTAFLRDSEDTSVKDYFIIGATKDALRLRKIGFRSRPLYLSHENVLEYDMSYDDIREFERRIADNEFIKVLQTEAGRVYEAPKGNFKKYCIS